MIVAGIFMYYRSSKVDPVEVDKLVLKNSLEYELDFCQREEEGIHRDDCYLMLALILEDEEMCENVSNVGTYRTFCNAVVGKNPKECDKMENPPDKAFCSAIANRNQSECDEGVVKEDVVADCHLSLALHNSLLDKNSSLCSTVPEGLKEEYSAESCMELYNGLMATYFSNFTKE